MNVKPYTANLIPFHRWINPGEASIFIEHSLNEWPKNIECIFQKKEKNTIRIIIESETKNELARLFKYKSNGFKSKILNHYSLCGKWLGCDVMRAEKSFSGISFYSKNDYSSLVTYGCQQYTDYRLKWEFRHTPNKSCYVEGSSLHDLKIAIFMALLLWEQALFSE